MTALHPITCGCYDCTPGFPATMTRVRRDDAIFHGPFFPATERRLECQEANQKWLLVPGNRDKARRSKAAHKARLRAVMKNREGVAP